MSRVGWLGLGAMGLPMAQRLIKDAHDVTGYDLRRRRGRRCGGRGSPASTAAEVSDGAEYLFVVVATPEQAQAALFGPTMAPPGARARGRGRRDEHDRPRRPCATSPSGSRRPASGCSTRR